MEQLQLQASCFESIKSLCTNYKKDSISRKNINYLQKRLESLENQWSDFMDRHQVLLQEIEDKTHKYFSDDIYGKTKAMYESTKKDMLSLRLHLQKQQESEVKFDFSGLGENADDYIKSKITQQECNFKAIDRVMSKIDIEEISEKWELEDYLSTLKTKWETIDKMHWELEASLKGTNESYYAMFLDIESKYDQIKKQLNSKIWSTVHYQRSAPRIEVPEFSGSYTQWISFKDLFLETIHNNPTINKAQKMQHLKTKLKGEAERLVQHLTINAENYSSCWEILKQRYDNRRLQFTSFMNTMLNLSVIPQPDAYNLKRMHDVITECMNGLNNIGVETSTWGPIIVHLMSSKLDSTTYSEYIKDLQDHRDLPNLEDFIFFLENKFMAYETMKNPKKEMSHYQKQTFTKPLKKNNPATFTSNSYSRTYHAVYGNCPHCNGSHVLMNCPKFINMNTIQRNIIVGKLRLCKNCLFSHGNKECTSIKLCKECNLKHHTLLHNGKKNNLQNTPNQQTSTSNHLSNDEMEVLLTTVQMKVLSNDGTYITLRALLDQGSQVNLITENAAQLLRLPRKNLNASVTGIGAVSGDCKGCLQLTCNSIHSDYSFITQALIMNKLTNKLPNQSFNQRNWPHLENLKLADPEYNISRPVDLLLGADIYSKILLEGVLRGEQNSPIAQQTKLGWILCGKLKTFNCHATLVDLTSLTQFWETEDIAHTNADTSCDDQCEEYYRKTVKKDVDNKYIVSMPLSTDFNTKLGKSRAVAVSQFLQLEKRLQRNTKLALMYREFMKEYIDLQHMKPSSPGTPPTSLECYLPHHGVLREQSSTTKLRVVFNASQKTSTGYSLNDLLEKGPNLQKDIQTLLLRWRSYQYAFIADVEKMYRCIKITDEQQSLQKIIWRDSPTKRLQEYQLCTVTYGTKCAPWLAMRTLKQLVIDEGHNHPNAARVLLNDCYMDDIISGELRLPQAKDLQASLISLLKSNGMNLRKWSANHPELLEQLSEDQISSNCTFDFKNEESTKTLGLSWNPRSDTFIFNWSVQEISKGRITKRSLLSDISKLYDPLGWLSPITVLAKLLFQRVWTSKLTWDEELPSNILIEWMKLKKQIPDVKNMKLNRWINSIQTIELLGFSDASEKAYSCVIYSRVNDEQNKPVITLLIAKTRVAPLAQKLTLPRLELCGALLLSKLMDKTTKALCGYHLTIKAWSDSQVVLAWLQGDQSKWDKYVANRVQQIKQIIPADNWEYVKSEHNPADCASRGMLPARLKTFQLWWEGPEFLKIPQKYSLEKKCLFTTETELAKNKVTTLATENKEHFINCLLNKYSSITTVIRVTAQVRRFISAARFKMQPDTLYLSSSELTLAMEQIIIFIQRMDYANEYKQLLTKKTITNKSTLYKLYPFLDEKGIIRVGGRLRNSNLPYEMKNPIILSRTSRLTKLLIEQAHLKTLHGGARLTLAQLRQRYWIIGGNRTVKAQLRLCVRCHRFKPSENYQLMADLPQQRTTPSRPFTHTGVDFTGCVEVKMNKGRGAKTTKGYIAIFVCMATKAVHIELVSDMSTETFIAAFQRMCARRGTPKHVYSDCGTNFIGASKMLRKEFDYFQQELTPDFFTEIGKMEVEWHFNAPAWPTAGGLWEAAVKSLKYHLRRVLGEQRLTFEEFTTLLAQIEACMNSRPLCPLTEDIEEFQNYLTPGHFLTGSAMLSPPISNYSDIQNVDLRQRWQLTEHMLQQFWKSWSNDYLTQLQVRSKWNEPKRNLREGDIVLVKDNNLPPGKWAMGRVLELHPGSDGYVRVTTIKTSSGLIKRPIVKLALLPLEETSQSQQQNHSTVKPCKTKHSFFTFITTLFTLFTLVTGSYGQDIKSKVHITTLERERPIYYDTIGNVQIIHDEWTLLLYYNLTTYWDGVQCLEDYMNGLNKLCQQTDPRYCKTTLEQLKHEMNMLTYYNSILLSPSKHLSQRRKRGLIDGVGYIANSLFGILDQHFAEKYQDDIQTIQSNENYLLELLKNQTSIVQLQNNVLKRNEENIKRQFNLINDFMKQTETDLLKVESDMEIVMASNYFNSISLSAYLLITNLNKIQEMLFETITNVYKGHLDVHLITPVHLIEQLTTIAGKLPNTLSLPVRNIRENIKDIYKLLYVKARVTNNYFLFEVHIPLISDADFTLYRAIPLPIQHYNGTAIAQLSSQYIAINFRENAYVSINEEDMKLCVLLSQGDMICNKNLPIFNLHNNKAPCEAKLLSHHTTSPCNLKKTSCKNEWIALHNTNAWLSICCGTCTIRTVCENDVTSHSITTSIITMAQGCVLQTQDLTIYSHHQYNSQMKIDFQLNIPNSIVNDIVNITRHNFSRVTMPDETDELEKIEKKLAMLKEREEKLPSSFTTHDIHQYAISYSIVVVIIIAVVFWILKRYKISYCSKRTKNRAKTNQIEEIELKHLPLRRTTETNINNTSTRQVGSSSEVNLAFSFE